MTDSSISRREALATFASAPFAPIRFAQDSPSAVRGVSKSEVSTIARLGDQFRKEFDLPGVSLAMSYRGKLKLLACFGYADKENEVRIEPRHQLRVASVSKPITAVALLKLAEQGKLKLNETVFGKGGRLRRFLNDNVTREPHRSWIEQITIRHLLSHTCGGWQNKGRNAPMFARPALGLPHSELIEWTLKNVPLKSRPGTSYAYSNFGYCLLGRVIESCTGKSYEEAVKELVLNPAGAKSTHIGRRTRRERQTNEVVYYDRHDPYGENMDVARMDSHGGWISTATDLVRFAQRVDGFETPPDILNASSVKLMTTPSMGRYALGWSTNKSNNWWHGGSFNGGSSILVRTHDGHCWAVLVNTRSYKRGYSLALDQFPWKVKAAVREWANHDLFS